MKITFLNTILFAMALSAAVSCTRMEESPSMSEGAGDYSIDLSAVCLGLETKTDKAGVDAYNENKLVYIDWFVFKSASDSDAALLSGRLTPSSPVIGSASLGTICLDDIYDQSSSFYVCAIANLPGYSDHDSMPKTLAGLRAVSVSGTFNQQDFEPQGSFVMRGGVDGISFSSSDRKHPKAISISLTRLAAKVSVNLNVVPAIDERETLADGSKRYVRTWYPDVEHMEVYLSFANSHTSVDPTPASYDNNFFTYYRTCFHATVPSTAPSWDGGKWAITGTPFYTYPMTWDSDSPQAPFLKVILKWTAYDESQNGTVAPVYEDVYDEVNHTYTSTFRHQRNKPAAYMLDDNGNPTSGTEVYKEFYYKVPLTNLDATYGTLEANDWLEIAADLSILGSTSDDLPVILSGTSYVTGWGAGNSTSGELRQAKYLDVERDHYEVYAQNEITIPVISSHDLSSYKVKSATYNNYSSASGVTTSNLPTWNSSTKQLASPDEISFDEDKSFTLKHVLNTDYTSPDLECARITYVITVTNEGGIESKDITITQYPPLYIENVVSNHNVFINKTSNNYTLTDWPEFNSQRYHPVYDDGSVDDSVSVTMDTGTSYTPNGIITIDVDGMNYTTINSGLSGQNPGLAVKKMHDNDTNFDGSVRIRATSPYWIYKIKLSYVRNDGKDLSPSFSTSDVTVDVDVRHIPSSHPYIEWYGETRDVTLTYHMVCYLRSIEVFYHDSNYIGNISATSSTSASANENMYIINVTDVSQLDFFISNTRSSTPVDFPTLHEGGASGTTSLTGYYPLNNIDYNDNAIAPRFLVASTYGGSFNGSMRFSEATKRCASYQENGYPAGRWRLPTDAEIKFIGRLSANGKIPPLFNGDFWGSSGRDGEAISVSGSTYVEVNRTVASVRCVYPLWFWGEDHSTYLTSWSSWQNN